MNGFFFVCLPSSPQRQQIICFGKLCGIYIYIWGGSINIHTINRGNVFPDFYLKITLHAGGGGGGGANLGGRLVDIFADIYV